jgi:hypothetical protein
MPIARPSIGGQNQLGFAFVDLHQAPQSLPLFVPVRSITVPSRPLPGHTWGSDVADTAETLQTRWGGASGRGRGGAGRSGQGRGGGVGG